MRNGDKSAALDDPIIFDNTALRGSKLFEVVIGEDGRVDTNRNDDGEDSGVNDNTKTD